MNADNWDRDACPYHCAECGAEPVEQCTCWRCAEADPPTWWRCEAHRHRHEVWECRDSHHEYGAASRELRLFFAWRAERVRAAEQVPVPVPRAKVTGHGFEGC